ncbi:Alpha/Beta hydrolase protein [Radiomyces spectabilis]|uniref:Alpha/Beta hydrolase protein n=1 Tax=Radiomyces spectabilis TaxID=64574 RepID=UPI0022210787|nr:Alpha/Beta hydrolase protein [Radiomyces spectabilis]KAI8368153.1 Alpha/Beta hydrolase protein [Radiomyces spectabilis]
MISIPILDRLSFRDYQGLIFTVLFFAIETVIRIIVILLPKFVINGIDAFIESAFPWLTSSERKPRVSPLEKAESFEQIIRFWRKYAYEQHVVRTQDDYFLCVHRIPYKEIITSDKYNDKNNQRKNRMEKNIEIMDNLDQFIKTKAHRPPTKNGNRPVVLLYHGFLMSSEVWVCNTDEHRNLPFVLSEQGYDVWLGNSRGNKYSQNHQSLSPANTAFWNFSLNEFAMYDLPDVVDYILEQTGASSLTYIGFSQGTAQAFAGLSVNPRLCKKVNLFIAMAPATTPKGLHHPMIDAFVKATPSVVYLLFGRKTPLKLALFWQRIISPPLFVKVIDGCVNFLFGWTGRNMTAEQKLVSYQHLYSLTSVKSLVHWFQIIRTGRFQMYDEVPSRIPYHSPNVVRDHIPPKFPTKQISTPIAVFYGNSDSLVQFDVLVADLPPLAYVKAIESWEHLDFLWGKDIEHLLYPDILKLLRHFNAQTDEKNHQLEPERETDMYTE